MSYEIDDITKEFDTPEKVTEGEKVVEEKLWEKLERVGRKISFAKDIKALYKYITDPNVSWHRKSIVVGALIYFISPIDTVPDLAPLIGYLDDLGVITAVLKFLGHELMSYYE
ncbi:YkvA family protein [Melioribacter sp. OK-6-Me]|uniref:YkvA family protein n=1 Tax=unclassified Melioribacter TaxID=2627329 RepID=UPI003EDAD3F8